MIDLLKVVLLWTVLLIFFILGLAVAVFLLPFVLFAILIAFSWFLIKILEDDDDDPKKPP